jgi:hypothetical protein
MIREETKMEFTFRDIFGENVVAKKQPDYVEYIRLMEQMRLNYERVQRDGRFYDPRIGRSRWGKPQHPGPMPIDLKVYVVALKYDPDKHRFPEIIAELAKHNAEIHPFDTWQATGSCWTTIT